MCKNTKKILTVLTYFILIFIIILTFSIVSIAFIFNDNAIKNFFSFTLIMSFILLGPSLFFILITNILLNSFNIIKKEKSVKMVVKVRKVSEHFFILLITMIFISAIFSNY